MNGQQVLPLAIRLVRLLELAVIGVWGAVERKTWLGVCHC